jgi:hypothetical protein
MRLNFPDKTLKGFDGDVCALAFRNNPPDLCAMKLGGETPFWNGCGISDKSDKDKLGEQLLVESILRTFQAFPGKKNTDSEELRRGMTASAWFAHVVGRATP